MCNRLIYVVHEQQKLWKCHGGRVGDAGKEEYKILQVWGQVVREVPEYRSADSYLHYNWHWK